MLAIYAPNTLLLRVQIGPTTWETGSVYQSHTAPWDPAVPPLGYVLRRNADSYSLGDTRKDVYNNFGHNYLKLETTQCPSVAWMNKMWCKSSVQHRAAVR